MRNRETRGGQNPRLSLPAPCACGSGDSGTDAEDHHWVSRGRGRKLRPARGGWRAELGSDASGIALLASVYGRAPARGRQGEAEARRPFRGSAARPFRGYLCLYCCPSVPCRRRPRRGRAAPPIEPSARSALTRAIHGDARLNRFLRAPLRGRPDGRSSTRPAPACCGDRVVLKRRTTR
jgi:hypothetical protein